jgi:type II secretory pathway component GspD/PulD (secretin)
MLAFPPAVRAAAILALLLLMGSPAQAQVSVPITDEKAAVAEDRIEAALQQQVSFDFAEEPLKEAIETIKAKTGLPIIIATKKLEEAAINLETPVTVTLRNLTLESFLRNFLRELGLTIIIKDEVIQITTPEDAGSQLITRLYPVLDLVSRRTPVYETNAVVTSRTAGGKMGVADYESLMDCITTTIDPDSWDDVGGPGSIAEFDNAGVLIISQTWDVHKKIGPLLNSLRRVKGQQGLLTIAPPARVSAPARSLDDRQDKRSLLSAESATPVARRRVVAPQRSWQLPQVYEE